MSKITRLERMRFSILTNDMDHCFVCGAIKHSIHEIYFGKNRVNSMKWGCCVPLCLNHHTGQDGVHNVSSLDKLLKEMCQLKFHKEYPEIDFVSIFHKNYL